MKGILDGIRIVDWTIWRVGPAATALLADMGADVIKVEQKGMGDALRGMTEFYGRSTLSKGRNLHFEEQNRNKRGIAVDLTKPGGKDIVYRLIKNSHVFATNFRPRMRVKLGLDSDTVKRQNPDIIYAASGNFGENGPEANTPGIEITALARSGVMWGSGEEGMPPIVTTVGIADSAGAVFLTLGILGALLGKQRLGISQEVFASSLGGLIWLQGWSITSTLGHGLEFPRVVRSKASNPMTNYYRCKDDRWVALGLVQQERHWSNFCEAIGRPELEDDPRFSNAEKRAHNREALVSILDKTFATKTYDEWEPLLRSADLLFSKLNTLLDLASDPQVIENDYIVEWDHPTLGRTKCLGFPVNYSKTPMTLRMPAPEVGQHNEEVLIDVCGYTWKEINKLQEEGAI